jgi:putative peptide zinc metalloprotease protein
MQTTNSVPSSPSRDTTPLPPPRLAAGVELLGAYDSSGMQHQRYLVQRPDGQVVLLSELLYLVAASADGDHTVEDLARQVSCPDRPITALEISYLIDHKLKPLGLVQDECDAYPPAPRADPLLSLAARRVFLPARAVNVIASVFRFLFVPPVILAVLLGLGALDAWIVVTHQLTSGLGHVVVTPRLLLTVLGLIVATTLFHEWGHAAGCKYGGGSPGAIGMAIYLIFPAFFTNVTDSYRLDRRGRLRTDLGGVYFNAIFIIAAGVAYVFIDNPALILVIVLTHLEMIQQMLPVVRLDGYYVLADLVGVPDLFARIRPILMSVFRRGKPDPRVTELSPRTRAVVTSWVLLVVPVLLTSLGLLLIHMPHLIHQNWTSAHSDWRDLSAAVRRSEVVSALLATVSLLVTAIPVAGLSILLVRSLARASKAVPGLVTRWASSRRPKNATVAEIPISGPGGTGAGSRLSVGAAVTAALLLAPGLPMGQHSNRTTATNTVVVASRTDDRSHGRLGWQIASLEGDHLVASNTAVAFGQCVNCLLESVAIQVVLGKTSGTIDATNRAMAVNTLCSQCQTLAVAYQFVVVSDERVWLTPAGQDAMTALRRALRMETRLKPPPQVLLAYSEALAAVIQQVLATQLRTANWPDRSGPAQAGATPTVPARRNPAAGPLPTESTPGPTPAMLRPTLAIPSPTLAMPSPLAMPSTATGTAVGLHAAGLAPATTASNGPDIQVHFAEQTGGGVDQAGPG